MKIAAAYIRVSTEEQTELSPDSQIKQIRDYAKKNGYIVPDEYIFHDDGISGRTTAKRPGFNKMIGTAKLKPKPFDAILLWKFSRFARNREDSIVYKSMLRKLGIEVISISENIGDDKMSVLIEAMIEAMDEYYSINLAEEVKRGMLEKFTRGQIVAAPPIGYSLKDGQYVPDDNAPLVKRIFEMFVAKNGYRKIANQLNSEGYRTIKGNTFENRNIEYIIRNPTYIGKLRWTPDGKGSQSHYHGQVNVMVVDGTHEAIINPELWEQAQEIAEKNKREHIKFSRSEKVKNEFMLRGLVRCSNCGSTLVLNKRYNSLQCHRYSKGQCDKSHYIPVDKINASVILGLENLLNQSNLNVEYRAKTMPEEKNTELLVKKEKEKLRRIKEAYVNGIDTIDEYKANKAAVIKKINDLESKRPEKITYSNTEAIQDLHIKIADFLKIVKDPNTNQAVLNQALKEFISKIVFDRANNNVELFFYL